jgi:catechol 2,3-dioxygenase-like lactoylglutathione lyase family enzyme
MTMPENTFQVDQIDHVELFVPDRYEAARWYERVLGLKILSAYEPWAQPEGGPLMISTPSGGTKLALFTGKPRGSRETAGFHRVAFRVGGQGFLRFLGRLQEVAVFDEQGKQLTGDAVSDHGQAFSIYFQDPYGHRLEITTYDHEIVRQARKSR